MFNAIYWDDWLLFKSSESVILETFRETGAPFNYAGHIHVALVSLGPWAYHVLTIILMFVSGIALWRILQPANFLDRQEKTNIVILFLVLPLFASRVAAIDFLYTLCYCSFFLGWWALLRARDIRYRIIAIVMFLFSFNTNSLLVFYVVPIAYLYFLENGLSLQPSIAWVKKRLDLLMLPLVFFWVKVKYFPPTGHYAGYNELNPASLKYILIRLLLLGILGIIFLLLHKKARRNGQRNLGQKTVWDKYGIYFIASGFVILFSGGIALPFLALFLLLNHYRKTPGGMPLSPASWMVILGLTILYLGMLPYYLVGKSPGFNDWDSRFQLLMPLGLSIIAVGINKMWGNGFRLIKILVVCSIVVNLLFYAEYAIDWQKQKYVISSIARSAEAKQASTIIVDDHTALLNARNRTFRFYEYTGWFKEAFSDETRLGVNLSQLTPAGDVPRLLPKPHNIASATYLTSEYKERPDAKLLMTIRYGRLEEIFTRPLDVSFKTFSK